MTDQTTTNIESELKAIQSVHDTLNSLPRDCQERVITFVTERLGLKQIQTIAPPSQQLSTNSVVDTNPFHFHEIAELFDAANPKTGVEKALVVAYWLQIVQEQPDFGSQSVNTELKHLGHGVSNITAAFTDLISQKLALQIQKSGKSQQARKKYKLTRRGQQQVEQMIQAEED